MKTTNIYTLTDPITKKIRYVGKANNIKERYRAHLNKAIKCSLHKKNWIESLKRKGVKPIMEVIDIVSIEDWFFWETYWISQIKTWGFNLINQTEGGDGCTFGNATSFKLGHGSKLIVALTKTGEFVNEFKTREEAESFCGKKCVDNALLGNIRYAGDYLWIYKDKYLALTKEELKLFVIWANEKPKKTPHNGDFKKGFTPWCSLNKGYKLGGLKKAKEIIQMDSEFNVIKEHKSISDAAKEIKCNDETIRRACINNKKAKGFRWKYK